jgi:hypothetical protein
MTPTLPIPAPWQQASLQEAEKPFVLWRDFKPRDHIVLDLVDDLLGYLVDQRLRIRWIPGVVSEFPLCGREERVYEVDFGRGVFRNLMARLCKLCSDQTAEWINPYFGKSSFTDPRWPHVQFQIEFVNTKTTDQHLDLTPVFSSEPQ